MMVGVSEHEVYITFSRIIPVRTPCATRPWLTADALRAGNCARVPSPSRRSGSAQLKPVVMRCGELISTEGEMAWA
jgi:hypothetical protein